MGRAPRVSVITVAFNAGATIADAVRSAAAQRFGDFEHVVVDGLSRDDTVERARAAGDHRLRVVSERDRGIYDAMNKGLSLARGELCIFLNADDRFTNDGALGALVETLDDSSADVAYGDVRIVSAGGLTIRLWRPGSFWRPALSFGWITPHPGFMARTSLLRSLGGFRLEYPIAADYDLMLRVLQTVSSRRLAYLPREIIVMQQGGESTASILQMWKGLRQCAHSMQSNGLPLWQVSALLKPARALCQLGLGLSSNAQGAFGRGRSVPGGAR
jgi:glycosyltransferase involved in cell wall biosynthesis